MDVARVVSKALSEGYQLDGEAFDLISRLPSEVDGELIVNHAIRRKAETGERILTKADVEEFIPKEILSVGESVVTVSTEPGDIEVVSDPTAQIAPAEADIGFKKLFQDRYWRLLGVARKRPDSKNLQDIETVKGQRADKMKIGGLVSSRDSRRGNVELTIDDPTGTIRVQCKEECVDAALRIPLDSFVLAEVSRGRSGQVFASSLNMPDLPSHKATTSSRKGYAVLLSDLHIGSKMFLGDDFGRFILWLNGKLGDLEIVSRVKYVIIAGDVIDGIGVYPGQENQLVERDLRRQYALAAQLISQIPKHIKIVVSPGNHDPVRQALPQPSVSVDLASDLYALENIKSVGNPSYVKLDGVNFLVYHGRSLDDIIATIPDLSYSRPAAAMQVLLKSRHLAPMYGKRTALSPELRDMLVIDPVPDVFHSGHVHAIDVLDYRGTLIVNSGTFQAQTPFQANMGMEPTVSIVPIVDLSTLNVVKRSFTKQVFQA
ncbi:MAG: DNA-directed DNA polymerase II small subunit [Nitrososphaerota archaeon]|nr:DNA-directed DNA polymerase II small subunit [Nitrososphaerota archaeon]